MVEQDSRKAGLMQIMRAQATQLLGRVEALTGGELLTKDQKALMPIDDALRDLQKYQNSEEMEAADFAAAHKRMQEISPLIATVVESMDAEQKKKYEKKSERKVHDQTLKHRAKLQAQFDELATMMPDVQKQRLNMAMQRMPLQRQEQFIAELVATHSRRKDLTEAQRWQEDQEMMALSQTFGAKLASLDDMQQKILQSQLANMLPSGQISFMKKVVDGSATEMMPPSAEEVKDWKAVYLGYFNSKFSVKKGRVLPLEFCVKNPRPDEIMCALRSNNIRAIFEPNKQRPNDCFHLGRIKFQLFDSLGNLVNDQYGSKRAVMKMIGKYLVESPVRTDPVTCAEKEKEGVFDMEAEMAQIEQAMNQMHGPTVEQAQTKSISQAKADKKKNKKRR